MHLTAKLIYPKTPLYTLRHKVSSVDSNLQLRIAFKMDLVANLKGLQDELTSQTYFPLPLLKILVDKGNGQARALCVPSVRDRIVETAVLLMIEPILESEFFDSVDHSMLLGKFNKFVRDSYLRTLIELWVKAEIWDGESLILSQKGIPQGSPVSPILANLFLDEMNSN